MVKPKKKTKWRSLTLEDEDGGGSGGSTTTSSITSRRNDWKYTNGGGGGGGGGHVNNENGSLHYVNGTKYADRRESRGASKTSSSASRYRQTLSSKSQANSQTEPKRVQFNEDEYTKITTPRQDVLFKKGYLSRPKVQTSNNQTSPELSAETALNGITSPLEGEFPYYPSQPYLSDGNYYGNAVYFMPLHDFYYNSPPNGFETDGTQFMAPYQPFSPPLECNDIASPQPLPSTSCSETSELSEDTTQNDAQQLSTSSTPPIASLTNNVATTTEAVVVVVTTKAAAITTTTTTNNTSTPSTITTSTNVAPPTTKIEEPVSGGEGVTTNSTLQAEPQQEQPPVVETTVQHNGDSNGASSNGNNYEMNQSTLPYYTPVYYVNFDCIPPMPYYPYQAINSYEVPEFYPIEVSPAEEVPTTNNAVGVDDIQRASQKAAAQTTVSPVGDDERNAQTDRGEKVDPIIPPVPPQILEIAHQSTLNADVQEFKPKIYQKVASSNEPVNNHTSRQLHAKKVSHQGNNNVTSSATATQSLPASHLPTSSNNNNNRKSRSTLDKKFIRESTKQIEMQNIDLSKKSSRVDVEDPAGINGGGGGRLGSGGVRSSSTSRIEWVIKGGKRVPVQIMPSSPSPPPPPRAVSPAPMHSENRQKSPGAHENTSVPVITTTDLQLSSQSMTKKAKQRSKAKKSQKKHFSRANNKFEGFVIEEPTFTKTEKHREQTAHAEIVVDEEDELQEAALIENIPWTDADVFDDNETEIEEPCEVREKAEIVDSHVEFEEIKLPEKAPVVNHVDSVIVMNGEVAVNGVLEKALDCRFSLEVIEEEEILSENAVTVDALDHIEAQEINFDATKNENELLPHVEQNNKGETFAVEPMTQDQFDEEVLTPEGIERFENHFEPPVEVDCVRIINEPVENHHTKVHEVLLHDPKVEEVKEKVTPSVKLDAKLLNGRKPDVSGTTSSSISIDVPSSSAPPSPPPSEPPTTLNGLSAEQPTHTSVSEPVQVIQKYEITAAVCAWLYNFNKNDLQSLFTIPLKADFVRKIKYCAEITKYFENDELTDLEKFVTEQFYQYQLRSSSPSSSWFTDDDDVDDNDEDDDEDNNENDDNQRHTSTNSAHEGNSTIKKFFGCEIM